MKKLVTCIALAAMLVPAMAHATEEDMRVFATQARQKQALLLKQTAAEKQEAQQAAQKQREAMFKDKQTLTAAIAKLEKANKALEKSNRDLTAEHKALDKEIHTLTQEIDDMGAMVRELVGTVRLQARDAMNMVASSPQNTLFPDRSKGLSEIGEEGAFPAMADIRRIGDLLAREIRLSGLVRKTNGTIVNRSGKEVPAEILLLGNFSSMYRIPGETGFLLPSDTSQRLFALSRLPSKSMANKINQYMDGTRDSIPMDISRGAAVRQMVHQVSLAEQVPRGGPIVWPILAIGVIAIFLCLEKGLVLLATRSRGEKTLSMISKAAASNKWQSCEKALSKNRNPLERVLAAGVRARNLDRLETENVLQEAILREIPRLERFLSTLGGLAGVAPLLGLLGTVTGMINTFHVITFYGTGDPKMMSGGISEALVTTMLGLAVAIPILLAHTLLARGVENRIGQMEEKAVAFVNTMEKAKNGS